MGLRKAKFQIDGTGEEFEGYTDGTLWNGWANVLFTREQAERYQGGDENSSLYFEADGSLVLLEAEFRAVPERDEELGVDLYDMNGFCFVEVEGAQPVTLSAEAAELIEEALREGFHNCGEDRDCLWAEPLKLIVAARKAAA